MSEQVQHFNELGELVDGPAPDGNSFELRIDSDGSDLDPDSDSDDDDERRYDSDVSQRRHDSEADDGDSNQQENDEEVDLSGRGRFTVYVRNANQDGRLFSFSADSELANDYPASFVPRGGVLSANQLEEWLHRNWPGDAGGPDTLCTAEAIEVATESAAQLASREAEIERQKEADRRAYVGEPWRFVWVKRAKDLFYRLDNSARRDIQVVHSIEEIPSNVHIVDESLFRN
jgi:hypothetical protein